MTPEQNALALEVFEKARDITVATIRPDGWPQATTVSFVSDGLILYFGSGNQSKKVANITRDHRVSVTANAPYKTWDGIRSVSLAGEASLVTAPAEMARVGKLMVARFGAELTKMGVIDMTQTSLVRITPKVMSLLDYSKGFGHSAEIALPAGEAAPKAA